MYKKGPLKKYIAPVVLLFVLVAGCKKKDNPVYTTFTLYVNGDSTWTTTDVTAQLQIDNRLIISATDHKSLEKVTFTLLDYRTGHKTYYIGSGTIPGYNYGSSATYDHSGFLTKGKEGQVAINNQTTHVIEGTFDVLADKIHISGSFGAPIPKQ
ncbi:MAG: hypothetical protein JWQ38_1442 [Flavipsychrobacter sp.]|nr:hypothetical protein [Flavipsychrobacter sp.]